jgi:beta-lactamase superfamily II metal-dependent hydrolase
MKTLMQAILPRTDRVYLPVAQSVRITVIDVGQGDALLVRTPNGRFALSNQQPSASGDCSTASCRRLC